MQNKDVNIQRQFIFFVVIPLFVLIVGVIFLERIFGRSSTTIGGIQISGTQQTGILNGTELAIQVYTLSESTTTDNSKDQQKTAQNTDQSETTPQKENGKSAVSSPTSPQTSPPEHTDMLFYAGAITCGGLIILVMIAGGILFLQPPKKSV